MATQTIRAPCDDCGHVLILPRDLTVIRYPNDTGWYRFVCPHCGQPTTHDATAATFTMLLGLPVHVVDVAPETGSGEPICADDLIDLHADLASL